VALGDGRMELSMFPPQRIGADLVRLVPEIPGTAAHRNTATSSVEALIELGAALEAGGPAVAWELARQQGWAAQDLTAILGFGPRLAGSLRCLVTAPANALRGLGLGQVVWFAAAEGWIGVQPEPGPPGIRSLRLVPVDPEDLATWVAPLVAGGIG
jgi:hypothetical protein